MSFLRHAPDWKSSHYRIVTINQDRFRVTVKEWRELLENPSYRLPSGFPDWAKVTAYVELHGVLLPGDAGERETGGRSNTLSSFEMF